MNNVAIKQNSTIEMSTPHNYFKRMDTAFKRLKKQSNTSRLLIIFLILWNIVLTLQPIPQKTIIPQFTDKQNEQIMIEEYIPPYNLKPIEE